jgi:hypothetical protein
MTRRELNYRAYVWAHFHTYSRADQWLYAMHFGLPAWLIIKGF